MKNNKLAVLENITKFISPIMILLGVISIPLNLFAGFIGGLWLIILGEWKLVIGGILASIVFPFFYSFIGLITMPLTALGEYLINKKKIILSNIIIFISLSIQNLVAIFWILWVFLIATSYANYKAISIIPCLLLGWSIAIEPFAYMAKGESADAYGTWLTIILLMASYIILCLTYILGIFPISLFIILFLIIFMQIYLLKMASYLIMEDK